jgi:hypothetical protein
LKWLYHQDVPVGAPFADRKQALGYGRSRPEGYMDPE